MDAYSNQADNEGNNEELLWRGKRGRGRVGAIAMDPWSASLLKVGQGKGCWSDRRELIDRIQVFAALPAQPN